MKDECEQLSVDFNIWGNKLFTSTYEQFQLSARKLDRQRDENVFQMQLGKYSASLKLQLERVAQDLLLKNKAIRNIDYCNRVLKNSINVYLREFRQKAKLL